jgi:hypothetical protein
VRLASLLFALVAAPALASAEPLLGTSDPNFVPVQPKKFESRQLFALEVKFAPYSPKIDQSAGLTGTPFADLFNSQGAERGSQPAYRLLTTIEFDYQFWRRAYGNFGVGVSAGYARRTTHAFQLNDDGSSCTNIPFCIRSGDETALNVIPLEALFVYRLDVLANRYHIPLVPYVKVGLAYYIWVIQDGGGDVARFPRPTMMNPNPSQDKGYGGSFGFALHPGLALQLDFIERGVAKTMDAETGINHTYLFCELNYANVNGFGASNKLNLSDTTFNAGLAFEF